MNAPMPVPTSDVARQLSGPPARCPHRGLRPDRRRPTAALVARAARSTGSAGRVSTLRPASPRCWDSDQRVLVARARRRRRSDAAPTSRRTTILRDRDHAAPGATCAVTDFMPLRDGRDAVNRSGSSRAGRARWRCASPSPCAPITAGRCRGSRGCRDGLAARTAGARSPGRASSC